MSNQGGAIGQILDKKGNVRCGDQTLLRLTRVQPENAKAMDFASALNGGYIAINDILG